MAQILEWENGNGWTIVLAPDEALELKSDLVSALDETPDTDIAVDLEKK